MDKQQIISYVMHTPGNTNPNVLGSMLDGTGGQESSIDFGTMDFTRGGMRYVVLDFNETASSYTINTSPTPFEIVDTYGYKRLNTTEEIRTAIEGLYDKNDSQYIGKNPQAGVAVFGKTPDNELAFLPLFKNYDNTLLFYDSASGKYGVYLRPDNSWELSYEG